MTNYESCLAHHMRSRSCGPFSGAEQSANLKQERKKSRCLRHSMHKRRTSLSNGEALRSKTLSSPPNFEQFTETCPPNGSPRKSGSSSSLLNGSRIIDEEQCTAITTYIADDDTPYLSVKDLSTVYKSLELLNSYVTLQGYDPYETGFLGDPRVTEILSHIQHGCPLARRPSKHLPTIDSSVLPLVDWQETKVPLKSDLSQLLIDRIHAHIHTDLEVLIGREVFCCHSLVLQCYSSYFDEVNGASKVHLPEENVSGRAFHTIYEWMISTSSRSFCRALKRDNIIEVLNAAQFLGIHELEEQCWAFINSERVFSEESAFLLYLEARKINKRSVMELMLPKVQKFFLKLISTVDFLNLEIGAVRAILGSNNIAVHNEMEVFMAAVLWLSFDWTSRRAQVADVMSCVRFGWLEPWQIVDIRRNYSSNPEYIRVTQNQEVRRMMEEGLAFATTRTACGGDWTRLRQLTDALCLTEPAPRHWLEGDAHYHSFHAFVEALPKYREADALAALSFRGEAGPSPAQPPVRARAASPPRSPPPSSRPAPRLSRERAPPPRAPVPAAASVLTVIADPALSSTRPLIKEMAGATREARTQGLAGWGREQVEARVEAAGNGRSCNAQGDG